LAPTEIELKTEQPFNILVRRRAAIGDVIMTTGVVRELKLRYGDNANIDIATDAIEVYRNNPHIRHIIPVDTLSHVDQQYQVYINLDEAYEINPTQNYVDNYFYRAFGTLDMDRSVELFPSDDDRKQVDNDLDSNQIGKFIVVHMRNWHWAAKNISIQTWLDVYTKLFTERADFKVVCVGGPTDFYIEDHPLFFDARGKYNSQQLKYLCDHAQCFVGIDSGPYWCASASKTPMVALLTHLRPEVIQPSRIAEFAAIQTQEDCRGCNDVQQRPIRFIDCKKSTYPCTSNWDTDLIANTILTHLT